MHGDMNCNRLARIWLTAHAITRGLTNNTPHRLRQYKSLLNLVLGYVAAIVFDAAISAFHSNAEGDAG